MARDLARLFVFAGAVPAILFPILYFFRSPWRSTLVGKMMMTKSSSIGLLFALTVLHASGVDIPDWLIVVSYGYLAVALYIQITVLFIEQRNRHDAGGDRPAPQEVGRGRNV